MYRLEEVATVEEPSSSRQADVAPPVSVTSVAHLSDARCLLLALVCSNNELVFLHASEADGGLVREAVPWYSHPERAVHCAAFTPSGRFLICVLENGSLDVVPVKLVLGDVSTDTEAWQRAPLFAEHEHTEISLKFRDDCLRLPTCAIYYETKHTRRPMLIYSNKGGDILFVDLLIRRISVSLQAPQSIHNLDIVEDAALRDVFLLVTGFASSQWLVPLETGEQGLRETLGKIVPSELKELTPVGSQLMSITSRGTRCVGILRAQRDVFQIYNAVSMQNPTMEIVLPPNACSVFYTDSVTFTITDKNEVIASVNHLPPFEEVTSHTSYKRFVHTAGTLALAAPLQRFVPIRFPAPDGCLPRCLIVSEASVYRVSPTCTAYDLFDECLTAPADLATAEALCNSLALDFASVCRRAAERILQSPPPATASPDQQLSYGTALDLLHAAGTPVLEMARMFTARGLSEWLLPRVNEWLMEWREASLDERRRIAAVAFDVHLQAVCAADGYGRNVNEHNLRDFLLQNAAYPSEESLEALLDAHLWTCCLVVLKTHDVDELAMRKLVQLDEWHSADSFVDLVTWPRFNQVFVVNPDLAAAYLRRLAAACAEWGGRRRLIAAMSLTDPDALPIQKMLRQHRHEAFDSAVSLQQTQQILTLVAELFISCLLRYCFGEEAATPTQEDLLTNGLTETVAPVSQPLACGVAHGVLLGADAIYLWGRTKHDWSSVVPTRVPFEERAVAVQCGAQHTLVLTAQGRVFSMGANGYGQLGLGHRQFTSVLTPIDQFQADRELVSVISCGSYHNAAVTRSGAVYTWGWGVHGQLALGKNRVDDALGPTRIRWNGERRLHLADAACGYAHTLVLSTDQRLFVCGNGTYGQLALGTILKKTCFVEITKLFESKVRKVACGHFHSLALTDAGALWQWGATPQSLKFKALLQKRKGAAVAAACGVSPRKELPIGLASVDGHHLKPSPISLPASLSGKRALEIEHMCCGFHHSLLLTRAGQLYSWGKSLEFQLGHGDKKERHSPSLVTAVGDSKQWRYAACGAEHTVAVDRSGVVWGWGRNDFGQLGFESLSKTQKESAALGRVLTIQRPNKTSRVITLPHDARVFVANPTRLVGLVCGGGVDARSATGGGSAARYDADALFDALRSLDGHYDAMRVAELCERAGAHELAAFVWLVAGLPAAALRVHAVALRSRPRLDAAQSLHVLRFYEPQLMRLGDNEPELSACLLVILDDFPAAAADLEAFFDANLGFWAPPLVRLMRGEPARLGRLGARFKLRLLQAAAATGRERADERRRRRPVDVAQQADAAGDCRFVFGGCGHALADGAVHAQLGRLQTCHAVNSALPQTAALAQQLFTTDLADTAAVYKPISSPLCPDCLGETLSKVAGEIALD